MAVNFNPRSRKGSDINFITSGYIYFNFNPRSRKGSDGDKVVKAANSTISIHAPAKGATSNISTIITQIPTFLYNQDILSYIYTAPPTATCHPRRFLYNFSGANLLGFSCMLHIRTIKSMPYLLRSFYHPLRILLLFYTYSPNKKSLSRSSHSSIIPVNINFSTIHYMRSGTHSNTKL